MPALACRSTAFRRACAIAADLSPPLVPKQKPANVPAQEGENAMSARTVFRALTKVEPDEIKAVLTALVYCFFIFFSYFIVRPLRDTMGTVYGVAHLQELYTGTFLMS